MENKNIVPNLYDSTKLLKRSLYNYQLSSYYRKINLDRFDFNHTNKNYTSMMRIMVGLIDLTKNHHTIRNIVLVLNNNNYELYMLGNNSYSKMLEDKGMTILRYACDLKEQSILKKRKFDINDNFNDSLKKYKSNSKNISYNITKKELINKRCESKTNSNSIDNKLIEKFKILTEKDKSDLLSFLDKTPKVNNVINEKTVGNVIDIIGNTDPPKNISEIQKEIFISEPSIGDITIDNEKNIMENIPVHEPIGRSKRTIKQVLRYGQEFC
jgi:hypothetical protein